MMRSILHAIACAMFAFCLGGLRVRADEAAFSMRAWETDEGLAHNGVNGIYQDRDDFLWLATQDGLVRFDGLEFQGRVSPLLGNPRTARVVDVIEENPGTLLVGCDVSGLVRMTKDGFSAHPLGEALGESRRLHALFSEAPDVFWILRNDRHAWRWDHGKVIHFPAPVGANPAVYGTLARGNDGTIYVARGLGVERFDGTQLLRVPEIEATGVTICSSANGGLWVASSDAMWKWDGGAPALVSANVPWSQAPPIAMLEDREGAVWLGSKAHGLFRCSGTEIRLMATSHPRISSLHEDREGNLWVGTSGGGVNMIQHARFQLLDERAGWTPDIEGCVTECPPGRAWFANSGVGLRQVSDGRLQPPPNLENWPAKAIPIHPDPNGYLWAGANTQLLRVTPDLSVAPVPVGPVAAGKYHVVYVTPTGTVWAGGENATLIRVQQDEVTPYGPEAGYTGKQAQAICEDTAGHLWVGTEEGDLFRGKNGHFTRVESLPDVDRSGIRALYGDPQGNLWVGTGGAGLLVKRAGGERFSLLTESHGLPDGVISQMVEDNHGMMWFGSSRGLFKVEKSDLLECAAGKTSEITALRYGKLDGLAGFSAAANYQPCAWKAKDGRLWFVSRKGIVIADPAQAAERTEPQVFIEKLQVDGRPRVVNGETRIPSAARKLDFDFTAPTFVSPEKVRFRYRLAGLEQEWNDGGTLRTASYRQLPPGKYQFEVMACDTDLVWNTRATVFPFDVVPAWWETWWARSLWMLSGVALLIVMVREWSHRRLKARMLKMEANRQRIDQERSRIARDLHDGLGAGLTQIGMMAEELAEDMSDPQEMKNYSSRIAGRVRGVARELDAAVWTVSPKNDTLAALSSYIGQYAIEYFRETPVRCRVESPEAIPEVPLSPDARHHLFLVAKEIMNNVLKHSGARNVVLAICAEAGTFHLEIADDGHGFPKDDAAAKGRHGLKNIRERVGELGGSVAIQSSAAGTRIAASLPISDLRSQISDWRV